MKKYELFLVLPGTLEEGEVQKKIEEIKKFVEENVQEATLSSLGKNRLSYPVKQIRYGYFYTITFLSEGANVTTLRAKLALRRDILRSIITHFNVELSPVQKAAYLNDDAGFRAISFNGMTLKNNNDDVEDAPAPAPAPIVRETEAPKMKVEKKEEVQKPAEKTKEPSKKEAPLPPPLAKAKEEKNLDMDEISAKLNKILDGENIIPGV